MSSSSGWRADERSLFMISVKGMKKRTSALRRRERC